METLIVHPTAGKVEAPKAFLKALEIDSEKCSYNPEFDAKRKRAEKDEKARRYKVIGGEDLRKYDTYDKHLMI